MVITATTKLVIKHQSDQSIVDAREDGAEGGGALSGEEASGAREATGGGDGGEGREGGEGGGGGDEGSSSV